MVTVEFSTLAIVVYGAIATVVIGYVIERLLTWHSSNIIITQKLSEDFIDVSKAYYMPLASFANAIKVEVDPDIPLQPKILFFRLAKYLSFYRDLGDKGIGYYFPKPTREHKIAGCFDTFFMAVNLLIFNGDKEAIYRVIKYYRENPDFLLFIDNINTLHEYDNFESICNNRKIIEKLYIYSGELVTSIAEAITLEYEKWYKFDFRKRHTLLNITKNVENEKKSILELYCKIKN